ncbi:MAG: hypothetical protein Q8R79_03655 [Legionellaceae bacterium]|nr:hypothetical protein [Legionellaceae bacterium]
MNRKSVFVGVLLLLLAIPSWAGNMIYHRSFWYPFYQGHPLAYCDAKQTHCGLAIAKMYCKMLGYGSADKMVIAHNMSETQYFMSSQRCRGWRCDGFQTINCVGKIPNNPPESYHYRKYHFVYPRYQQARVDYCLDGVHNCGKAAAYSFCRRMGYMQQKGFAKQEMAGSTKALGNQKPCFGKKCVSFQYIDCYR